MRKLNCVILALLLGGSVFAQDNTCFVVNNTSGSGWTIVSEGKIMAYSDEGRLEVDNLPQGMKEIFKGRNFKYGSAKTLELVRKLKKRTPVVGTKDLAIGPLLTTTWDQFEPYYRLTPEEDGTHCATCCVATALAQILYYLYYTQGGQQSTTFQDDLPSSLGIIYGPRTYEWAKMLTDYKGASYTDEQAQAVALLMRDCGYALNVSYGVGLSTAYSDEIKSVAANYFGLDASSTTYTNYQEVDEFFAAIDKELNTYHPVQVCGSAHSFVCDGRDASGEYYHFNFGYSGGGNGFYSSDAYNGYASSGDMALTTGLRLAGDPLTPETAFEKLLTVYNAAVYTASLRPVGGKPGFYQQTHYDVLEALLKKAYSVISGKESLTDEETLSLINNIGQAEQLMVTRTTPYPDDWYYIRTAAKYNGMNYAMRFYKQGGYVTPLDGGATGQKFKFVYDEETGGYFISNYGGTIYLAGLPGYGKDPLWSNTIKNVPCEVIPTDRIGDTDEFMVTIRPMAEGYKDDTDRYLAAWTNDETSSWPCSADDTPIWVYGTNPYYDCSKWTLTSASATGVETVNTEQLTGNKHDMFNLAGQRVNADARGLIIQNGRKVVR